MQYRTPTWDTQQLSWLSCNKEVSTKQGEFEETAGSSGLEAEHAEKYDVM
jgi:hypothetical protein